MVFRGFAGATASLCQVARDRWVSAHTVWYGFGACVNLVDLNGKTRDWDPAEVQRVMYFVTDAIKMIRDIRATNPKMRIWGALLNITQLIGGLIFVLSVEGQVILVTVIVTLIIAGQIHNREPFSRLTGLCHLPWLLLLPWLLHRLHTVDHSMYLSLWGLFVVVVITISLVIDVFEVVRYVQGKRAFSWADRAT